MIISCYLMETIAFITWLQSELDKRGWSQADLARAIRMTTATVSRVMSGDRKPGIEFLIALAGALKVPPEEIYRAAGLLPPITESKQITEEINYLMAGMTPDERQEAIEYLRYRFSRSKTARRNNHRPRPQSKPLGMNRGLAIITESFLAASTPRGSRPGAR